MPDDAELLGIDDVDDDDVVSVSSATDSMNAGRLEGDLPMLLIVLLLGAMGAIMMFVRRRVCGCWTMDDAELRDESE